MRTTRKTPDATPATPVRTAEATPVTPTRQEPAPASDPDEGSSVSRRVQDLAERCVAVIRSNNAARAGQLLHGDTGGLMSAINDGRIADASAGSLSIDGNEARFRVNISWRAAFGGNKSAVARMTAETARGCVVESSGGVK